MWKALKSGRIRAVSLVGLVALVFCVCPHAESAQGAQAGKTPTFTLDLRQAPVQLVLRSLFQSASKNFSVDANVHGTVTVVCRGVTFDKALADVLSAASPPLTVSVENGPSQSTRYHLSQPPAPAIPSPAAPSENADINGHDDAPAGPSPAEKKASPLTPKQAVQAARSFCQAIGQPVTGTGEAVFPAPSGLRSGTPSPRYWRPCWLVTFPHQAVVQVADVAGDITGYADETPPLRDETPSSASGPFTLRMTMLPREAIRQAKTALAATGAPDGALFTSADMNGLAFWDVSWARAYDHIPYRNAAMDQAEFVSVRIGTQQGRIQAITFDYPSPPVTRPMVKLSRDQAIRIAQKRLGDRTHFPAGTALTEAFLCIVPRSHDGADTASSPGPTAPPHPVWVVRFHAQTGSHGGREIRVDAENGAVEEERPFFPPSHFGA